MHSRLSDLARSLGRQYPSTDREIDLQDRIIAPEGTFYISAHLKNRDEEDHPYIQLLVMSKRQVSAQDAWEAARLADKQEIYLTDLLIATSPDRLSDAAIENASRIIIQREDNIFIKNSDTDPLGLFIRERAQAEYSLDPFPRLTVSSSTGLNDVLEEARERCMLDRYAVYLSRRDLGAIKEYSIREKAGFISENEVLASKEELNEIEYILGKRLLPMYPSPSSPRTHIKGYVRQAGTREITGAVREAIKVFHEVLPDQEDLNVDLLPEFFRQLEAKKKELYMSGIGKEHLMDVGGRLQDIYREGGEYLLSKLHIAYWKSNIRKKPLVTPVICSFNPASLKEMPEDAKLLSLNVQDREEGSARNALSVDTLDAATSARMYISTIDPCIAEAQDMILDRLGIRVY